MFIEVNQIRLFYEDCGKGLPVILLHGYPLDHTIWNGVVSQLESHARCIIPDLRGHGQTDAPRQVYTMRSMAADITGLLDQLEIEQAVLVGHSMGGYVALAFAQAFTDRLVGLALVASQAGADNPEQRAGRLEAARAVEKDGVKTVADKMPARLTSQPELVEPLRELILHMRPEGIAGALQGMAERPDLNGWISSVCVPTVVVAGDEDKLIPLSVCQDMADRFPNAALTVIPGTGHMPMLEKPDQVAAALAELVDRVHLNFGPG